MLQQTLNSRDPEKILLVVKNVDGTGSLNLGLAAAYVLAGASTDGISVTRASAANIKGFCGVSIKDIPVNGYGLVCVWGWASVVLSNVGTSITITKGDVLIPGAVAGTFFSSVTPQAMSTLLYKYVVAADTATISAAGYVTGLIRGL